MGINKNQSSESDTLTLGSEKHELGRGVPTGTVWHWARCRDTAHVIVPSIIITPPTVVHGTYQENTISMTNVFYFIRI